MSDLRQALDRGWVQLAEGVADAGHPMRFVALATAGAGGPEARTVGLRRADPFAAEVDIHTDLATPKVAELGADPRCSILAWNPAEALQLRLKGRGVVRHGPSIDLLWDRIPPPSRTNYGTEPAPGVPIPGPYDYDKPPRRDRFAVVTLRIDEIDLVHLPEGRHRRALYRRADGFAGTWVAP